MKKYLDDNGLLYLVNKIKLWLDNKANKVHSHTKSDITDLEDYELPTASGSVKGGIKVGAGLSMTGEVLSATGGGEADSVQWDNVLNKPTIPTDTNQLSNGANFQNASQVNSAINSAVAGITSFSYEIVATLPATGVAGTIYLLSNSGTNPNSYDEYIWVSDKYEKIGTTDIDLSNYLQNEDLEAITNGEIDTITA